MSVLRPVVCSGAAAVYPGFGGQWQTWGGARLRIGLITDEFDPKSGGAERWAAQDADHVPAAGHVGHVITFRAPCGRPRRPEHVPPDPRSRYGRALAVEAAVGGPGPMGSHDSGARCSARFFHRHSGSTPLSVEPEIRSHIPWRRLRAVVSPRLNPRRRRIAQIEGRAAVWARRVVAASPQLRGPLAARHHLDERDGTVLPNGEDMARFASGRLAVVGGVPQHLRPELVHRVDSVGRRSMLVMWRCAKRHDWRVRIRFEAKET
jgi:hypothetical protein